MPCYFFFGRTSSSVAPIARTTATAAPPIQSSVLLSADASTGASDDGSAGSVAGTVRFRVGGPGGSAAAPESADRPGHRHGGDLDPLTVGLLASAATGLAGGLLVMLRRGGRGRRMT